jgi:hypothetical protein
LTWRDFIGAADASTDAAELGAVRASVISTSEGSCTNREFCSALQAHLLRWKRRLFVSSKAH